MGSTLSFVNRVLEGHCRNAAGGGGGLFFLFLSFQFFLLACLLLWHAHQANEGHSMACILQQGSAERLWVASQKFLLVPQLAFQSELDRCPAGSFSPSSSSTQQAVSHAVSPGYSTSELCHPLDQSPTLSMEI